MGQLTSTDLIRGLLHWIILTVLFGAIASWVEVFRRLLKRGPLLPRRPFVERRETPWGVGTVLLTMVVYVLVSRYAFEGYALATRGEHARRGGDAPIRIDKKDAQARGRPDAVASRGQGGPRGAEGPGPQQAAAGPDRRPDAAESLPWGLSLTELMFVQGAINSILIVLLPCLARLTSGARLRDFGVSLRGWRRQAAVGIVAILFLMPIIYAVQAACVRYLDLPDPEKRRHPVEKMLREDFSTGAAYLAFLTAVILAPIFEELLFRGLLQSWLVKALNRWPDRLRRLRGVRWGWLIKAPDRSAGPFGPSASHPVPLHPSIDPELRIDSVIVSGVDLQNSDDVSADTDPAVGFWDAEDDKPAREARPPAEGHETWTDSVLPEGRPDEVRWASEAPDRPHSSAWTGAAIILTSLVFAALHAPQWPAPIPLFLLALGLGVVYQRTGSLITVICMHAVFNGFSTLMLFYATLGGPAKEKPEVRPVLERVAPVEKGRPEAPARPRDKT